ncbi:hypothetical protein ACF09I_32670 [Streptomyces sp. NPDC014940]|uniref:hypothetical protein n=1 Tax=Streptomyces sp. NPDC014940 TaxID=3364932 RepID=UPI0036F79F1A
MDVGGAALEVEVFPVQPEEFAFAEPGAQGEFVQGAQRNPVLKTEGRVTLIDGVLAAAVLVGLLLNSLAGLWWADPAAGYVLVYYALREAKEIFSDEH